jgi:hypothetical protein
VENETRVSQPALKHFDATFEELEVDLSRCKLVARGGNSSFLAPRIQQLENTIRHHKDLSDHLEFGTFLKGRLRVVGNEGFLQHAACRRFLARELVRVSFRLP